MDKKAAKKEKKRKIAGWSTKMLEEVRSKQENEDTEDTMQRGHMSQEGIREVWKELNGKMEEEVLEKYKRPTRCVVSR